MLSRRAFLGTLAAVAVAPFVPTPAPAPALAFGPHVSGAGQSGAVLVTDGWCSGSALFCGDVIEIVDTLGVHPVTGKPTIAKMFVVTADAREMGGRMTLPINPPILTAGPYRNVAAGPAHGAQLRLFRGSPLPGIVVRNGYTERFDCLYGSATLGEPLGCRVTA